MFFDVDKLVEGYFKTCYDLLAQHSDKIHLIVRYCEVLGKAYPVLDSHWITVGEERLVVLNIAPTAVREFTQSGCGIGFNSRFQGVDVRLNLAYGDMVGMTVPGQEVVIDFSLVAVTDLVGGQVALRPLNSEAIVAASSLTINAAIEAAVPKRPHLSIVK